MAENSKTFTIYSAEPDMAWADKGPPPPPGESVSYEGHLAYFAMCPTRSEAIAAVLKDLIECEDPDEITLTLKWNEFPKVNP